MKDDSLSLATIFPNVISGVAGVIGGLLTLIGLFFPGAIMPNYIVLPLAIVIFFCLMYKALKREHACKLELRKQLDALPKPHVELEIDSMVLHYYGKNSKGSALSLWVTAHLHGGIVISEHGWRLTVVNLSHQTAPIYGERRPVNSKNKDALWYRDRQGAEIEALEFDLDDDLDPKISKPLQQPCAVSGMLRLQFPSLPFATIALDETIIQISCTDESGHAHAFHWSISEIVKHHYGFIQSSLKARRLPIGMVNYAQFSDNDI